MRIKTLAQDKQRYFLTIFFREVGSPQLCRIGHNLKKFGKGRDHLGELAWVQIEVEKEGSSIEFFPGARILGIVCDENPGVDQHYVATLGPRDEVEFTNPNEIVTFNDAMARDVMASLDGKERMFLEKQLRDKKGRREFIAS